MTKQQEIIDFYATPGWSVDDTTSQHIVDAFVDQDFYQDPNAPEPPDMTPVFWNGQVVGTRDDLKTGKIDPLDKDAWGF